MKKQEEVMKKAQEIGSSGKSHPHPSLPPTGYPTSALATPVA